MFFCTFCSVNFLLAGTWLEAVFYYAVHFETIKTFVEGMEDNSPAIEVKKIFQEPEILCICFPPIPSHFIVYLSHVTVLAIHVLHYFKTLPGCKILRQLERNDLKILVAFTSAHIDLPRHRAIVKQTIAADRCRLCLWEEETPYHLLACPATELL
jgi:hypothetical protein